MWISKSKLKNIERQLKDLSDRVWVLENPPKFKKGDIVEVDFQSRFVEFQYNYIGIIVNQPRVYGINWVYDILIDNEIKEDIECHIRIAENPNLSPLQAETHESDTNVPKSGESA